MAFYTNIFLKNNKLYLRGYNDDNEAFADIISDYRPSLYLLGTGPYRTVDGKEAYKKEFSSIRAAFDFIKQYSEVDNFEYYGLTKFVYTYLNDRYPGKVSFDTSRISVVSLDIEVDSSQGFPTIETARQEITAITLVKNGKSITFGLKNFETNDPKVWFHKCTDEVDLLKQFLLAWNTHKWNPDIVTGWSVDLFDIPYLVNRIRKVLGESYVKKLSPFGFVEQREIIRSKGAYKNFDDRKEIVYDLQGITTLDYLQLYKKFTFTNHESYSLNNIAKVELNEQKVDYGEYGNLDNLYLYNPQKFYEYNIHDAMLVEKLEDKLNFIKHVVSIAYQAKVNYTDAMVTLRPWDVIIHNYLLDKGIVIPQIKRNDYQEILGAYVKVPQIGMHRWVVSFDFDALYPSIISQHNISPDTFVEKLDFNTSPQHIVELNKFPENGGVVCANGTVFRKDIRGFIPEVIDEYANMRREIKNRMLQLEREDDQKHAKEIKHLDLAQQAIKILNNGLYGALSNRFFRWYDADLAEAVTYTAQVCTRYVEKEINLYLNKVLKTNDIDYVIAADTDSVYLDLEPLVVSVGMENEPIDKVINFLDKICKAKLEPVIDSYCQELYKKFKVYIPKLHMKREVICDKVIWRAPKMYALHIHDKEGKRYKIPQIKSKGMEVVRSSTPMICREKLKKAIEILFQKDETEFQKFIAEFKEEFMKLPFQDIAFPRTANDVSEYYDPKTIFKKGTPVHVRGAIVYNEAIKTLGLTNKYQPIKDKDKVRWLYLKKNNPFNSHVIAAPDELPPEFELVNYFDREMQWEKSFLHPIESLTSIIGWSTIEKSDLREFI